MDRNVIILAAGASSRMRNSVPGERAPSVRASIGPKGMTRVGNRPFLDYLLFNIEKSGYEHVVIVVRAQGDSIRDYYERGGGAGQFPRLTIEYAVQEVPPGFDKPLGTADALEQALRMKTSWRGRRFTLCNSDNLYSERAFRLLLEDTHANAMVDYDRAGLRYDIERIALWAVTIKDRTGFLQDIIEKPSREEIDRSRDAQGRIGVSMNIWRFSYDDMFPLLSSVPMHPLRSEKELNTAVRMLIAQHPQSLYALPLSEHVIDLTSQSDIPVVDEYVRREYPELSS